MKDEYKTVRSTVRSEMKVQGSLFIASASPATTKLEAESFVATLRKEFWNATHNCFAYRLGVDGTLFRFNDDGEPGGSAGKPILAAIDKFELTDTILVVTRYFGGTKLGVGGLMRAYGDAAENALLKAEQITKFKTAIVDATFPYSHISNVMHVVSKVGARIIDTVYDEQVHAMIDVRLSKAEELKSMLVSHSNRSVTFQ